MATKLTYRYGKSGSDSGRDGALLAALCLVVAAWIVAGSIALAADFGRSDAARATSAPRGTAGAFTGALANGMPVYRLPSLTVVGHRDAEPAGEMREAQRARAHRADASTVARPCPHVAESSASSISVRVL